MTFLDMVRRLSAATRPGCGEECMDVIHRHDAAWHLGAILADPVLMAELARRAALARDVPADEPGCRCGWGVENGCHCADVHAGGDLTADDVRDTLSMDAATVADVAEHLNRIARGEQQ